MRSIIGFVIGVAAGYSICRVMEARASGLRVRSVFRMDPTFLLTPVATLALAQAGAIPGASTAPLTPDGIMAPNWR